MRRGGGLIGMCSPGVSSQGRGLSAIVLLRRDRRLRGFRLREVSSADGLVGLILATSSLYLSPRYPVEQERCMPGLVKLVNSAPCFEVRMGTELVDDPVTTVQSLVEAVRR